MRSGYDGAVQMPAGKLVFFILFYFIKKSSGIFFRTFYNRSSLKKYTQ